MGRSMCSKMNGYDYSWHEQAVQPGQARQMAGVAISMCDNSSMYSQPPTTGPLSGIRHQYATSTIEHYPSLPELMHAVYDCSSAMDKLELAFGLGRKPLSLQVAIGRV
jgi:hypothetical protein